MSHKIKLVSARQEVQVQFDDRLILSAPIGTSLRDFFEEAAQHRSFDATVVAAVYEGKLRELSYAPRRDGRVEAVTMRSTDGARIYRRSLVLLLTAAAHERFGARIAVKHAMPDGAFWCEVVHRPAFSPEELAELEHFMRQMVIQDEPIIKRSVPLDEAEALFAQRGDQDKVRLLQHRTDEYLTLYSLRSYSDYYYGYMTPSVGCLQYFRLIHQGQTFLLQYPHPETPDRLEIIRAHPKITEAFNQTETWLERLGIEDIGRLNALIKSSRCQEIILVAEALHEQGVARIAHQISERYAQGLRVVLIAGPSSSGKTTFSKRLAIQLLAHGIHPLTLEMDMYFVDRSLTPRDENGDYDFESFDAINISLFNQQLGQLLRGESVQVPRFDFVEGRSLPGRHVRLRPNQIILIEGIHGLNPSLVTQLKADQLFRVYVSVLAQVNLDMHNRVPTTDVRLLRRIVRDARTRGYDAQATLERWASVQRGEKRNIFPYQENADAVFNSALMYELAALRPLVEPLLLQVKPLTWAAIEARRLLAFLRWVVPLPVSQINAIPDTSLLREFIGASILDDYHPTDPFSIEEEAE
ncbi:MAG: nucleoside kinase [Anaerolineae bacterium]|nr:nucleoside kinase [Anaerolineae bacterium]MDW8173072.1 nucleoside kinase [Anaerolineae bacterium]